MDLRDPMSPENAAREEGAPTPDGWDSIAALTGGEPPERFEELGRVRALEPVYPLLHALAGRGLREFFVRAAALEALVASERPAFGARDVDEILYFLDESARDATMKALRASGWLEHDPAEGTRITDAGRWAYDILAFLHKRIGEAELPPTVEGVEYALRIGIDPLRHLLSMRSRLTALRAAIDAARASHSEVILRRTAGRISDVMKLSEQIRAVLRRVPVENAPARAVAREVHDLLARLHGSGSELHRDVTEVGRQHLQLTGGLTNEQFVRALMRRSRDELAAVGREAPPRLGRTRPRHERLLRACRDPPLCRGHRRRRLRRRFESRAASRRVRAPGNPGAGRAPAPRGEARRRGSRGGAPPRGERDRGRAAEAAKARSELSACRERYLEVVQHALQDYRRRAIEIGRDGGVVVEMDLPRLANEDRAIDDAELHARFGFDGKDVAPLGDSSFSGGQRVIAGVILLMATVEGAGRGFFMLDEPFAHLSIDRIDDVGRFFRAAGAQFIITAPTTLDRAQLDPASLVLLLQKKRGQDAHAPVPIVAEA